MSTKDNELSFSGDEEFTVTGNDASETKAGKRRTADQSQQQLRNSQKGQKDFSLSLDEFLPIFQEDLRILKDLGARWKIVPKFGPGYCAIVFENLEFVNGDFLPKDVVTGNPVTGSAADDDSVTG